ncbi:hypothetical protein BROUX41_003012 [Berkeleyomyces rouxiae]|uniref:uncharacterized protein n=1 Tax=Berkeleyomyces rouxiae TaxID=2035830 RepID=UPI003B7DF9E9
MAAPFQRRRILFLDAYDSFTNNIVAMLKSIPGVSVSVLKVDAPSVYAEPRTDEALERFHRELARFDAVVCGPGPGSPDCAADVGLMRWLWDISDRRGEPMVPVLGICLGFQSMSRHFGGSIRRLRGGLHGMVRPITHAGWASSSAPLVESLGSSSGNIFAGVAQFNATLYHSLCVSIGQDKVPLEKWQTQQWTSFAAAPDLIPLAWHVEDRGSEEPERILMGVKHFSRPLWGLQYHPESACTESENVQVIVNWLEAVTQWNETTHREVKREEVPEFAIDCLAPSHLDSLAAFRSSRGQDARESGNNPRTRLAQRKIKLPAGIETPDLLEILQCPLGDQIILDSSNHNVVLPPKTADVRGAHSIVALDVAQAMHIEYRIGSSFAVATKPVDATDNSRIQTHIPFKDRFENVWQLLAEILAERKIPVPEGEGSTSPFVGGFLGYLTYELGLENIHVKLGNESREHQRPDLCFAWVTKSLVVDHRSGFVYVQHLIHETNTGDIDDDSWINSTIEKLQSSPIWKDPVTKNNETPTHAPDIKAQPPPANNVPREESLTRPGVIVPLAESYCDGVAACQQYIAAGESYELCLTDQTTISLPLPTTTSPDARRWRMFRSLRKRQPAPFGSYIRLGSATLISSSPERFLDTQPDGLCTMRPMKGTVRKSEAVQTIQQAEQLLHVPKEIAENLMIVDLVRHDLQTVCAAGDVAATHLMKVEEYATVFTMVTIIKAQLPQNGGYTGLDALAASFPPGSMTGAPKKRSCEILTTIEQGQERSMYSGVVGYIDATGRADWSVTIRSLFSWDDEATVDASGQRTELWRIGAGGAVTTLSTPEGETAEMYLKLAGPLGVLETLDF